MYHFLLVHGTSWDGSEAVSDRKCECDREMFTSLSTIEYVIAGVGLLRRKLVFWCGNLQIGGSVDDHRREVQWTKTKPSLYHSLFDDYKEYAYRRT